jgi:hypothetical protein
VTLETSTRVTGLSVDAALYEEASPPTLLPDGITRILHHRVLYPTDATGGGSAFARLRVTAQ